MLFIIFVHSVFFTILLISLCKVSKKINFYFRIFSYGVWCCTISLLTVPLLILFGRNVKHGRIYVFTTKIIRKLNGFKMVVEGKHNLKNATPGVILLNHQCFLDMFAIAEIYTLVQRCAIIMKKELLYVPFFGWCAYFVDSIFIKREDRQNSVKTIKQQTNCIREKNTSILIFPEGTRNRKKTLLHFKRGPFYLAVDAQCPIYPVIVQPFASYHNESRIFNGSSCRIKILTPVDTSGLNHQDVPKLIEKTYKIMQNAFTELWNDAYDLF